MSAGWEAFLLWMASDVGKTAMGSLIGSVVAIMLGAVWRTLSARPRLKDGERPVPRKSKAEKKKEIEAERRDFNTDLDAMMARGELPRRKPNRQDVPESGFRIPMPKVKKPKVTPHGQGKRSSDSQRSIHIPSGIRVGKATAQHQISEEWIEEQRKYWGEDSEQFRIRVLGEFPTDSNTYREGSVSNEMRVCGVRVGRGTERCMKEAMTGSPNCARHTSRQDRAKILTPKPVVPKHQQCVVGLLDRSVERCYSKAKPGKDRCELHTAKYPAARGGIVKALPYNPNVYEPYQYGPEAVIPLARSHRPERERWDKTIEKAINATRVAPYHSSMADAEIKIQQCSGMGCLWEDATPGERFKEDWTRILLIVHRAGHYRIGNLVHVPLPITMRFDHGGHILAEARENKGTIIPALPTFSMVPPPPPENIMVPG